MWARAVLPSLVLTFAATTISVYADGSRSVANAAPARHWAFVPPVRPSVPVPEDSAWRAHPVDAFLRAKQEERALRPVGLAERSILLRRVWLDLVGLPPSEADIRAFESDSRPDAWERVVDALLARPQHGERWARHFMDIWRYTDWFGLGAQLRNSQKHIWRWRDWIVESLNEDLGYDRMILEMLAADEIAPRNLQTLRASGYLARSYYLFNRTTWLDETIEHSAKAFLGLTMNCAKCHDHKYDPISQVDYYRFRAIFEPHQIRLDPWPGETDLEKDGLPRAFDAHPDARTWLHIRGDPRDPDESRVIEPGPPEFLAGLPFEARSIELPPEAHSPGLRAYALADRIREARAEADAARAEIDAARSEGETARLDIARARLQVAEARIGRLRAADAADRAKLSGLAAEELADRVEEAARAAQREQHARAMLRVARARAGLESARAVLEAHGESPPAKSGEGESGETKEATRGPREGGG